jgi:outer membrane murein-binding lipoprotein Lpp
MKNSLVLIALAGSLAGSLLAGCGKTPDQKVDDAQQTVAAVTQQLKSARDDYRAEWQSFKRETEQVIDANGRMIDSLKIKIEKAGNKGKVAFTKDLEVLEQKNVELKKKLADYNDQGQSNWEVFKSDVKRELDGLGNAMRDLYKKIG